jgi:hypothetical protein
LQLALPEAPQRSAKQLGASSGNYDVNRNPKNTASKGGFNQGSGINMQQQEISASASSTEHAALRLKSALGFALLLVVLACSCSYGDVGVVLNESLGPQLDFITSTGHTAVYFSRICAESPVKLRLCRPGEEGSVMSTYRNLGEDSRYAWNIVPLSVYVYGVGDARNRPVFGSEKIKSLLEDSYRDQSLTDYCSLLNCRPNEKGDWRFMVGAGLTRGMYIFVVRTTPEQDMELIEKFNSLPNQNHFNAMTHNCADFVKGVVDTYFPHAAHRDVINDFGMTSPKAVAHTFTHYGLKHPELQLRVLHFSQAPGTIRHSGDVRNGTELFYRSGVLLVPMVIYADYELPMVAATHMLTGRFNPEREYEQHPAVRVDPASLTAKGEDPPGDAGDVATLRSMEIHDREEILGTKREWEYYRQEFDRIVQQALKEEVIPNRRAVGHFFEYLEKSGTPLADSSGALWMEVKIGGTTEKVGISMDSILAPDSDPQLAFALLLARVDQALHSPAHRRESMVEFKEDWAMLEYARDRASGPAGSVAGSRPQAGVPEGTSGGAN